MRYQLKRIHPASTGKVFGLFMFGLTLLFAPLIIIMALFTLLTNHGAQSIWSPILMMVAALVVPFIYGAMGYLQGLLIAWVYNLVARTAGPLEIELETAPTP
jgi:hypothetical protein